MTMKFTARDGHAGVKGRSIIDHRIRTKTNTTCQEYCIVQFIHHLNQDKKVKYTPVEHTELLYKSTGYYPEGISKVVDILMTKGLVMWDNGYLTTEKWDQHFFHDIIAEFESLWTKCGKVGNRSNALEMYRRCLKEHIEYQYLLGKLETYLQFIEETGTFQLHLSTWLNPKTRNFDNEYDNARKKQPVQQTGFSI